MIHSIVYVSTAAQKLSNKALSNLAETAGARNATVGITGLLL
jgi:hypothetical protein